MKFHISWVSKYLPYNFSDTLKIEIQFQVADELVAEFADPGEGGQTPDQVSKYFNLYLTHTVTSQTNRIRYCPFYPHIWWDLTYS